MHERRLTTYASALFVAALFVFAGCASEPEPKPDEAQKAATQKKAKKTIEVEKPSPEELAKTPCGNPDWAQLPPGAEDKTPSQDSAPAQGDQPAEEGGEPAETQSADEAAEKGEQSSKVDLYPNDRPCT